jgi:hypothetical protein
LRQGVAARGELGNELCGPMHEVGWNRRQQGRDRGQCSLRIVPHQQRLPSYQGAERCHLGLASAEALMMGPGELPGIAEVALGFSGSMSAVATTQFGRAGMRSRMQGSSHLDQRPRSA